MPANQSSYDYIVDKIRATKEIYPSLRAKSNEYVFSALCLKSVFYKNPSLILTESDITEFIVDGQYDGGVDILFSDPNSEGSDLVICQSKFYRNITFEDVSNALVKMAVFFNDMVRNRYEQVNATVQRRFMSLFSEIGDESKIHFVFFTSALQAGMRKDRLANRLTDQLSDRNNVEVSIFFAPDIEDAIKESESRRPTVETGKLKIDEADNALYYGEEAAIVNVSACSVKQLYAQHGINLLSRNLRYHIAGRDIDDAIKNTIRDDPDSFWLKNNGITIVCDSFEIDGRELKLKNFSIVNGGQTTYLLHKSTSINSDHDLFLPCKIIKIVGNTEDEKNAFSLSIAKATNTQKPIKPVDLKANSPEQIRFAREMRQEGIFYQTKRGEVVPRDFRAPYLNTDLVEIGKLCLAAIFQVPAISRAKPSSIYKERYYETVFNSNQAQIAKLCKELLYIDNYFRTVYQREFYRENANVPESTTRISFANNSRTICIAFVAFAARFRQENITERDLMPMFNTRSYDDVIDSMYDIFRKIDNLNYFIEPRIFENKTQYEDVLKKLFNIIIEAGITSFSIELRHDPTLIATNYLKRDRNYYDILCAQWQRIKLDMARVFEEIGM